jgi:hypothetical protein
VPRKGVPVSHDLPLRQMVAAHHVSAACRGLEIGMMGEKLRDLGLATAQAGSLLAPCRKTSAG